ncbi:unnamed protein product [Absidia cylindrospora]
MAGYPGLFRGSFTRRANNNGYWNITHPNLNDDDNSTNSYKAHYRVNQSTFNWLVNTLSTHSVYNTNGLQDDVYLQIACVLWRFANSHFGYRMVSVNMGIAQGSYHNYTERFMTALYDTHRHCIRWPVGEDAARVAEGFIGDDKLPGGVIGAIDGKLVVIHSPHGVCSEFYRDRKNNLSLNLLAVCDSTMAFTHVNIGNPGRTHDARAYARSGLSDKLQNHSRIYTPNNTFILGDSAYPLKKNLITPYPRQTNDQSILRFNTIHSGTRMVIERAFALLVSRWRFVKDYLYLTTEERLVQAIHVCCILHNICLGRGDFFDVEESPDYMELQAINDIDDVEGTLTMDNDDTELNDGNSRNLGVQRRNEIRALLDAAQ